MKFSILFSSVCVAFSATATATTTFTSTWNVSTTIPDNDDVGFSDTRIISAAGISTITGVTVDLSFAGGWNGDLYAYLVHDSGFAILLNRPGRSTFSPDGSATVGLQITLDDSVFAQDIHTGIPMSGSTVAGTYNSDGRVTDPYFVMDTDARAATLASFNGLDGNGSWTLFVAD